MIVPQRHPTVPCLTVRGILDKEDYKGLSKNLGASMFYGVDYGWSSSSALSFTIGNGYGLYGGLDYYWCLD